MSCPLGKVIIAPKYLQNSQRILELSFCERKHVYCYENLLQVNLSKNA